MMFRGWFLFLLMVMIASATATKNIDSGEEDTAPDMADLPVFQSANGELNLLMEARQVTSDLAGLHPQTWVYQVCHRASAENDTCPDDSRTAAPYGGVRLQLQPGDHLKIRLVNRLPSAPPEAKYMLQNTGQLAANPTNLHTHGMIVEPRRAGNGNSTYGDYVYVLGYPAGKLARVKHAGMDYTDKPIDYDIYIPRNHPSGLFWFHPHIHGLSVNQVTAGLSGVITVGSIGDYVKDASGAAITNAKVKTRYLLLKDIQVEKNSRMLTQEKPLFCTGDPAGGEAPREGFCAAQKMPSFDYRGGKWIHSINGQVYPSIHVSGGEVWRITAASASRSYDLKLVDDASGEPLMFQVLSLDGVSLGMPEGTPATSEQTGLRSGKAACRGSVLGAQPLCGTSLHVMPSSRVEIYLSPASAQSRSATLLTESYHTGPVGDEWPAVKLARVLFAPTKIKAPVLSVREQARKMLGPDGVLSSPPLVKMPGIAQEISINEAVKMQKRAAPGPIREQLQKQVASLQDASCQPLAKGHRRRIFFGLPPGAPAADLEDIAPESFGLGYEEIDAKGKPVLGTFKDIAEFKHTSIDVCLPLAPGNVPVTEQWELVNVSGEDHNFHMHQTKFWMADGAGKAKRMMDSVPVPHGTSSCNGTVATWRSGKCQVKALEVDIPFSQVGDFMYHCHIMEHEDGGMMAHIRVVANQ